MLDVNQKLDVALVSSTAGGVAISLMDIQTILGIMLIVFQISIIVVKLVLTIIKKMKNKENISDIVPDVIQAKNDIEDIINSKDDEDENLNHK